MELFRFLLNLLSSFREHYDIAFKIGLLSLELPRAPASIKPLEVKLFHLENDVADLLRKIPLTDEQYKSLRIRLEKLKAGTYKARGYKLLPNALTSYILDVTMMNTLDGKCRSVSREISESLCFEAALASLSLKPDVCEFEHSLLVEGLRRQRCDLALRMLDLYKDDPKKIFKIMDVIIDQDIDVNMKKPLHLWYYQDKPKQEERLKSLIGRHKKKRSRRKPGPPIQLPCKMFKKMTNYVVPLIMPINQNSPNVPPLRHLCNMPNPLQMPQGAPSMSPNHPYMPTNTTYMPHSHHIRPLPGGSGPPNMSVTPLPLPHQMNPSQAAAEVSLTSPSVPNQLPIPFSSLMQPSFPVVPAPALPPGIFPRGPMPTSKVSQKYGIKTAQGRTLQHPNGGKNCSRASSISSKSNKNKCGKSGCKRLVSIVYKNRSTEALAHSMTELAKSVLFRSGGHLASSFYIRDSETGSVKTPNHVLHMCALQLAMYGLGISNNASTSWESRSYSPHVAMLTSLAIDIGAPAFMFIIENWPGHLTPSEAISLADRGSRSENPIVTNLAAKLALSCLTHADKLNSHEIIQAINQCQNLGFEMQEKACCEVEVVAKSHSLQSEVLFYISKLWYNIYMKDESEDAEENENVRGVANNSKCSLNMNVSCFPINRAALALNNQSKTSTPVINDIKLLQKRTYYLLTSYRLSMMAFQNLTSETSEEKAHYRFHCLPNYTTDVNRTMQIAKLLGDKWVHHFCMVVESTLVNPFLLYEVASSAAFYFARYNPSTLHYYMRTVVDSLINKCQTMFFFYLNSKLFNMAQYEEDEYINMAQLAHKAFSVSADGPYRYQEWLQSIRSKNVAIRDLYTKITDAIEQEERMSKNTIRDTTEAVAKESMLAGNSAQASGPGSSIGGGANPGVRLIVDDEEEDEDDDDDEDEDDEEDDDEDEDEEEDEYEEEEDEDGSKSNAAAGSAAEHAAPMSRHRAGLPGDAAQPGPSGFSKCKNKDASNDGERVQRK